MASTTSRSTPSTTTLAGSSTGSTNAMRRRCTRITRKRSRRFWNDRTRAVGSDRGFRDGRRRSISAAGTIVTRSIGRRIRLSRNGSRERGASWLRICRDGAGHRSRSALAGQRRDSRGVHGIARRWVSRARPRCDRRDRSRASSASRSGIGRRLRGQLASRHRSSARCRDALQGRSCCDSERRTGPEEARHCDGRLGSGCRAGRDHRRRMQRRR